MTYLKKRLKALKLGINVQYSSSTGGTCTCTCGCIWFVLLELRGCNSNIGYRQMWAVLKDKHSLVVVLCCAVCVGLHFVINNAKVPQ